MTKKPQKPKKMGRPPLAPGKRRGASMGFRPTPKLREELEGAAKANGRSMSQEVEERLGQSFREDETFGSMGLRAMLRLFGNNAVLIEQQTGKSCFDDWDTWVAVQGAWKRSGADFGPLPPEEYRKALQEAGEAVTGILLKPVPDDADQGERSAHLIESLKGFQALSTYYRHQRDERAQEAVGVEIVSALLEEQARLNAAADNESLSARGAAKKES